MNIKSACLSLLLITSIGNAFALLSDSNCTTTTVAGTPICPTGSVYNAAAKNCLSTSVFCTSATFTNNSTWYKSMFKPLAFSSENRVKTANNNSAIYWNAHCTVGGFVYNKVTQKCERNGSVMKPACGGYSEFTSYVAFFPDDNKSFLGDAICGIQVTLATSINADGLCTHSREMKIIPTAYNSTYPFWDNNGNQPKASKPSCSNGGLFDAVRGTCPSTSKTTCSTTRQIYL